MRNLVLYQIFVDRFSRGTAHDFEPAEDNRDVFCGGNVNGIREHLDYLQDLGINAIWLTPICKTNAYHGYHILDFYSMEPRFGTLDDLRALCDEAHGRGMKVLLDFVANHVSDQHPFFQDAIKNPGSKYRDWFHFTDYPSEYHCFLQYKDLPKLHMTNADCMYHVIGAAEFWLEQGIDGFRLDHVIGTSEFFWQEFSKRVRAKNPAVVLLGEAWLDAVAWQNRVTLKIKNKRWLLVQSLFGTNISDQVMKQYVGILDGLLDFTWHRLLHEHIGGKLARAEFEKQLHDHYRNYPPAFLLPTFLDNHDMNRILLDLHGDKVRLKQLAQLQFSVQQPAIIYYGTEIGMSQSEAFTANSGEPHGDLRARRMMEWDQSKWDHDLLEFYKKKIREKTKSAVLIKN